MTAVSKLVTPDEKKSLIPDERGIKEFAIWLTNGRLTFGAHGASRSGKSTFLNRVIDGNFETGSEFGAVTKGIQFSFGKLPKQQKQQKVACIDFEGSGQEDEYSDLKTLVVAVLFCDVLTFHFKDVNYPVVLATLRNVIEAVRALVDGNGRIPTHVILIFRDFEPDPSIDPIAKMRKIQPETCKYLEDTFLSLSAELIPNITKIGKEFVPKKCHEWLRKVRRDKPRNILGLGTDYNKESLAIYIENLINKLNDETIPNVAELGRLVHKQNMVLTAINDFLADPDADFDMRAKKLNDAVLRENLPETDKMVQKVKTLIREERPRIEERAKKDLQNKINEILAEGLVSRTFNVSKHIQILLQQFRCAVRFTGAREGDLIYKDLQKMIEDFNKRLQVRFAKLSLKIWEGVVWVSRHGKTCIEIAIEVFKVLGIIAKEVSVIANGSSQLNFTASYNEGASKWLLEVLENASGAFTYIIRKAESF